MIDDEVQADVRAALELAGTVELDRAVLAGVDWDVGDERAAALHPGWAEEELLPDHVRERLFIGRSDLLAIAARCRDSRLWSPLLVAVDAWGGGTSDHGPGRTRRIRGVADVETRLRAAVAALDEEGPVEAYYLLSNDGHVHGWGPGLFTRFLEVADRRDGERALGLDRVLAVAANGLVAGCDLGPADWRTAEYAFVLGLLHRIAGDIGAAPTVVEAALAAKFAE